MLPRHLKRPLQRARTDNVKKLIEVTYKILYRRKGADFALGSLFIMGSITTSVWIEALAIGGIIAIAIWIIRHNRASVG